MQPLQQCKQLTIEAIMNHSRSISILYVISIVERYSIIFRAILIITTIAIFLFILHAYIYSSNDLAQRAYFSLIPPYVAMSFMLIDKLFDIFKFYTPLCLYSKRGRDESGNAILYVMNRLNSSSIIPISVYSDGCAQIPLDTNKVSIAPNEDWKFNFFLEEGHNARVYFCYEVNGKECEIPIWEAK